MKKKPPYRYSGNPLLNSKYGMGDITSKYDYYTNEPQTMYDLENEMESEYSKAKSDHELFNFAFCGTPEAFNGTLRYLASIAEPETWTFNAKYPYDILKYYLFYTFRQCHMQGKVLYSEDRDRCCINTGLLDNHGNDILIIFEKNRLEGDGVQEWFLKCVKTRAERDYMEIFDSVPELATYTENTNDYYFDPNIPIVVNYEHILEDNWSRIYEQVQMDKEIVRYMLSGIIDLAKKRAKRNMRLLVPQIYNGKIMFLMPITFPTSSGKNVTMALALERVNGTQYRGNTIFTKEDAYKKARLLMKPNPNWLIEE